MWCPWLQILETWANTDTRVSEKEPNTNKCWKCTHDICAIISSLDKLSSIGAVIFALTTYVCQWFRQRQHQWSKILTQNTHNIFPLTNLTGKYSVLVFQFFFLRLENVDRSVVQDIDNIPDIMESFPRYGVYNPTPKRRRPYVLHQRQQEPDREFHQRIRHLWSINDCME